LDLSIIVSVPTSRRPIDLGSMLYLRIKLETTGGKEIGETKCSIFRKCYVPVRAMELMSSLSSANAM